jgi:hypothetical protein
LKLCCDWWRHKEPVRDFFRCLVVIVLLRPVYDWHSQTVNCTKNGCRNGALSHCGRAYRLETSSSQYVSHHKAIEPEMRVGCFEVNTHPPLHFEDELSETASAGMSSWKDYGIIHFNMSRSDIKLHVHTHEMCGQQMNLPPLYYWLAWRVHRYWLPK